jgi:hypothetical protein
LWHSAIRLIVRPFFHVSCIEEFLDESDKSSIMNFLFKGLDVRFTDGNNWYRAYIDGTALVVQKRVAGAITLLESVPFIATAGTSFTLRFRVVGTILYANVWQSGTPEPSNWMVMVSDTSLSTGYCGLRMLAKNGAIASYTSFQATFQ